jgi:hypothetical protein
MLAVVIECKIHWLFVIFFGFTRGAVDMEMGIGLKLARQLHVKE